MFKTILESIFLKESLNSARQFATTQNISQEIFDKFNALDTTNTKKLIHQILKWYVADGDMVEKQEELIKKLGTFIKFSGGRIKEPIEKFKTYAEFSTFIEPFLNIETKSEKKDALAGQYKKIFENENMLVILPFTHKASCIYGAKTKWCTTAKSASHFKRYLNQGYAIYYVLNKIDNNSNNPFHKMAVVVDQYGQVEECYDTFDNPDYLDEILNWISDRGIDKKHQPNIFQPMTEHIELLLSDSERYSKVKNLRIGYDFIVQYMKLIKLNLLDKIFPATTSVHFALYDGEQGVPKECPPVPTTTKSISIDNDLSFKNFDSINNKEGRVVNVQIRPASIRTFTKCNQLIGHYIIMGYENDYKGKMELIKNMICKSPFKSIKITFQTIGQNNEQFKFRDKVNTIAKYRLSGGVPPKIEQSKKKKK